MSSCRLIAHVPRRHCRGRVYSPVLFSQNDQRPSVVSHMISFGASDDEIDDSLFFLVASDVEDLSGSVIDPTLLQSSSSRNARLRADEELIRIMTRLSMSSDLNGLRGGAISQQAGRVFLTGQFQAPRQHLCPFHRSSYELTILWHAPTCGTEEKRIRAPTSTE